ncbi:MAG: phosphoketolase family protein [Caulobacteraceae bacterium]
MTEPLSADLLNGMHAYWRAANYLSVGQIYLQDNPLLETPLGFEHIKPRLLGHFGTTPGLNLLYVHLNRLIRQNDLNMMYVIGPGHGGPGLVANTYLEGSYTERYPAVERNRSGLRRLFRQFSWPYGVPSHVSPETPGSIHEGGELGYSLAHAYGAAFDNPELIVACVVGDGEAETGPLAASWHSNKFLNPARDGAVLPILHLNGFKIANPTILARISREELTALLCGYGYEPHFVEGDDPPLVHQALAAALDTVLARIREIQGAARAPGRTGRPERPRWPMIVLRTPKGWTGPKFVDGLPVEGTWRAHQVPIPDIKTPEHLKLLEEWMQSYRAHELFDEDGAFREEFAVLAPTGHRRMGSNPHANGGELLRPLSTPNFHDYAVPVTTPGAIEAESTRILGRYLRDVMRLSLDNANFRLFGPDETASNRLEAVYEVSGKEWMAEVEPGRHGPQPRRPGHGGAERAHVRGVAGGLSAHRPARPVLVLRGLHPHRGFHGQPARQVAEGQPDAALAQADRLAELPSDLTRLAPGPQRLLPPGSGGSSTTWPTRRPTPSASTCRRTPTACCR